MAKGDFTTKVISKSGKDRQPTSYKLDQNKNMIRTRSGRSTAFKEIVELTEVGKNKKGKTIFESRTFHVMA